jgi:hypothetical protein
MLLIASHGPFPNHQEQYSGSPSQQQKVRQGTKSLLGSVLNFRHIGQVSGMEPRGVVMVYLIFRPK